MQVRTTNGFSEESDSTITTAFSLAEQGALELTELMSIAEQLSASGRRGRCIELYRLWLRHTTSPLAYVALFNLGVALSAENQYSEAEQMYRKALEQNPDLIQARLNLGNSLEQQGNKEEALKQWRVALEVKKIESSENRPLQLHALNNLGRLLEMEKNYRESLDMLEKSFSIDPTQRDVLLHLIHLNQKICNWPIYRPPKGITKPEMIRGTSPLAMVAAFDDPALQLSVARRFVEYKYPSNTEMLAPAREYKHSKIRIGYLSSDFCLHAVSLLTVQLYELHNREKFEVYGFCWSREDGTALQQRVITAMDHFIRIGGMNDKEAAECIRSHEIDIVIDLQGLTSGARPYILSYRPAPVQATYLGFTGTTALPWIDYVIADTYLIPDELAPYFTEKSLNMPHCFQVSDTKREVGAKPARSDNNLPEDGFVFCAFNNNYKFTPELFAVWMRILKRVPGSVLWLLADNEWARENMCKAAKKHGIKSDRLIFATRAAPPNYLARYQIADLFLDTFPFNGGTTANDALWMGLPLLTCSGRTFASRMAGSLLMNLGLPELVTTNFKDYENTAVKLAKNRNEYLKLKERLHTNRVSGPVFDMPKAVRDLEELLAGSLMSRSVSHRPDASISKKQPQTGSSGDGGAIPDVSNKKKRLVVYTVLIGDKEGLNDPLCAIADRTRTDLEIDYICFTDNTHLESPTWRMEHFSFPPLPPEKLSRRPKALPHEYLSDYQYSLYIDNTIAFRRLPNSSDLDSPTGPLFRAFRHPWRTSPLDEADMVVHTGYEDQATVNAQIEFCSKVRPLGEITHLTNGTVLLREHNDPAVKKFGTIWWEQILAFSRRDQLSLDFSMEVSGCHMEYFKADFLNNDFVAWPVLANGHRIQASFDAARYAWKNREIPEAAQNPRKHFLEFGKGLDKEYKQTVAWFEHACRRTGSSLGSFFPPRRGIANVMEQALKKLPPGEAHLLAVRVDTGSQLAFDQDELTAAVQAITAYFKFNKAPLLNRLSVNEKELETGVIYTAAFGVSDYDAVFVFGVPETKAYELTCKFISLVRKKKGRLVLQLNGSLSTSDADKIEELMKSLTTSTSTLGIFHSTHMECADIISNSLLLLTLDDTTVPDIHRNNKNAIRNDLKAGIKKKMKINLVNYEAGLGIKDGILTKYAEKMEEGLRNLGVAVTVTSTPDSKSDINHHINYLAYQPVKTLNTLMVTHFTQGTESKLSFLRKCMETADVGISMSPAMAEYLTRQGIERQTYVLPAHDGLTRKRKVIAILTKTYPDGRKREWMLPELVKTIDKSRFAFKIMGDGWKPIVESLKSEGMEQIEYFESFDIDTYGDILNSSDYILYTGDEDCLAQSLIDATQVGVKTIAKAQPDIPIDYPFDTQEELNAIFKKLEYNPVEDWTWENYCRKHLAIWEQLIT